MLYPRVRIIMVWQRPGDDSPRACYWQHEGTLSDVAAAETYAAHATRESNADMTVYTFSLTTDKTRALEIAKSQYRTALMAGW